MSIETNIKNILIGNKNVKEIYSENNLIFSKRIYLYNNGDENTELTGGWEGNPSLKLDWTPYQAPTKNSNNINVKSSGNNVLSNIVTINKIDLSNYRYLKINYLKAIYSGTGYGAFCLIPNRNSFDGIVQIIHLTQGIGEHSYDLKNVSGQYYLGILMNCNTSYPTGNIIEATFDKVWLEE